eukprot:snap_masked-scaffold_7-processed-gene-12.12-mRNA-1 protein AED:1.00 eAED:1.00 QI:0/0/0/0/1/1/5/0/953
MHPIIWNIVLLHDKNIGNAVEALSDANLQQILFGEEVDLYDSKHVVAIVNQQTSLRTISLYYKIEDYQWRLVGDCLCNHPSLTKLSILNVQESAEQVAATVLQLLRGSCAQNLEYLEITKFIKLDFKPDFYPTLEKILEQNTTLLQLNFGVRGPLPESITKLLARNQRLEAMAQVQYAIENDLDTEYLRSKMMFIGKGAAGKTTTLSHLFNKEYDIEEYNSTVVGNTENEGQICLMDGANWKANSKEKGLLVESDFGEITGQVLAKHRKQIKKAKKQIKLGTSQNSKSGVQALGASFKSLGVSQMSSDGENHKTNLLKSQLKALETREMVGRKYEEQVRLSLWDIAGQEVFYTLHHLFLTEGAIYILVVHSLRFLSETETELKNIRFWMDSLSLHCPKSPVLIVFTQIDKLEDKQKDFQKIEEELWKYLKFSKQLFIQNKSKGLSFFPLSNKEKSDFSMIQNLRKSVEAVTQGEIKSVVSDIVHREIKLSWLQFMDYVGKLGDYVPLGTIEEEAKSFHLNSEFKKILEFFNEVGSILFFDRLSKDTNVVTFNPQWLMNSFGKIIFDNKLHHSDIKASLEEQELTDLMKYLKTGVISYDLLFKLWADMSEQTRKFLVDLGLHLLLAARYDFETGYSLIIPNILDNDGAKETIELPHSHQIEAVFDITLPLGYFSRVVCYLAQLCSRIEGAFKPIVKSRSAKFSLSPAKSLDCFLDEDEGKILILINKSTKGFYAAVCQLLEVAIKKMLKATYTTLGFKILCCANQHLVAFNSLQEQFTKGEEHILDERTGNLVGISEFSEFFKIKAPEIKRFDAFLSHSWGVKNKDHEAVIKIEEELEQRGLTCWIDTKYMIGSVFQAMVKGLEKSEKIVIFLSRSFERKVENVDSNVRREFNYACFKVSKVVLVALEKSMVNPEDWTSPLLAFAFGKMKKVIDLSSEEKFNEGLEDLKNEILA